MQIFKKNSIVILKSLTLVTTIISAIVVGLNQIIGLDILIVFFLSSYTLFSMFLLLPFFNNIINGSNIANNLRLISFFIQAILSIVLFYSLHRIIILETLHYEIWQCFLIISFLLFLGIDIYRIIKDTQLRNKDQINKYRIDSRLAKHFVLIFSVIIFTFVIYEPKTPLILDNIRVPFSITLGKFDSGTNKIINESIEIKDKESIEQIFVELSNKHTKQIRNLGMLQYAFSLSKQNYYLLLLPNYDNSENLKSNKGFIDSIIVFPNGSLYIKEKKERFIILKSSYRVYKVDATETMNKIERLID